MIHRLVQDIYSLLDLFERSLQKILFSLTITADLQREVFFTTKSDHYFVIARHLLTLLCRQ